MHAFCGVEWDVMILDEVKYKVVMDSLSPVLRRCISWADMC